MEVMGLMLGQFVDDYTVKLNLPNPDIIRREVAQVAPGLDFDVLNFLAPKITLH